MLKSPFGDAPDYLEEFIMGRPADNKQSTPKIALPSKEQGAIRRAKKAKHRHGTTKGLQRETFVAGLEQNRLKARGVKMLDIMELTMTSSSPRCNELLGTAMTTYVAVFSLESNERNLWQRHKQARTKALQPLSGGLLAFAQRQLDLAFNQTRDDA